MSLSTTLAAFLATLAGVLAIRFAIGFLAIDPEQIGREVRREVGL